MRLFLISGTKKKGVLAQGASAESSRSDSSVTPKKLNQKKRSKDIGPSAAFGTHSAIAKRAVTPAKTHIQNPPHLDSPKGSTIEKIQSRLLLAT